MQIISETKLTKTVTKILTENEYGEYCTYYRNDISGKWYSDFFIAE